MPEAIGWRGIHLDLKGAPLPIDVLLDEVRQMAAWGVNLLLVEYEDTFPYRFDKSIQAATAYCPADVQRLDATCKSLDIQIVPLVQTFGHLEYVLKHKPYSHLAQTAGSFQSIDPTLPEGQNLVLTMIDEFLAAHPDCRWLHLGGDEVWDLGEGERSRARAEQVGKDGLYLEHMMPIIDHVLARGIRPILWDDMMRHWPMESLQQLAPKTDLMPWSYGADPFERFTGGVLERFQKAGIHLWAGAAFKGADGITANLPDDRVRMNNLNAWARCTVQNNWEGMVATGWSRYNGLSTYCELWQAAPMALYLAASAMRKGTCDANDWGEACRQTIGVSGLPLRWSLSQPRKALDAASEGVSNPRLTQLKAIAGLTQWVEEARRPLLDGLLAMGHFEDPGRYTAFSIARTRKYAEDILANWPRVRQEFEQALGSALYPQDVKDYLASRYRIGAHYLKSVLDAK